MPINENWEETTLDDIPEFHVEYNGPRPTGVPPRIEYYQTMANQQRVMAQPRQYGAQIRVNDVLEDPVFRLLYDNIAQPKYGTTKNTPKIQPIKIQVERDLESQQYSYCNIFMFEGHNRIGSLRARMMGLNTICIYDFYEDTKMTEANKKKGRNIDEMLSKFMEVVDCDGDEILYVMVETCKHNKNPYFLQEFWESKQFHEVGRIGDTVWMCFDIV